MQGNLKKSSIQQQHYLGCLDAQNIHIWDVLKPVNQIPLCTETSDEQVFS